MKVALTQSEGRLAGLAEALTERGHEAIRQPLIRTEPMLSEAVRGQAERLLECSWLLFTSPNAAEAWHALGLPFKNINPKIGVVGEKTARAVHTFSGEVALIGEPQNAAGLADTFLRRQEVKVTVGLPRGNRSLKILQERLGAGGVKTSPVTIYQTVTCDWQAGEVDAVILASPSAAEALPEEVGKRAKLISIGPSTSAAVIGRGWRCIQAETPSAEAVERTIVRTFEREEKGKEEVA